MTSLKIDKVNIEITKGKIRLRWTYQGQRFSLSMGNDNPQNLDLAKSKAYQINSDICKDAFNFNNYRPQRQEKIVITKEITLLELWNLFLKIKVKSGLKAKSIEYYENIDRLIQSLVNELTFNAFDVQEKLLNITTNYRTVKALKALSACCEYGIERKLIKENNFKGVWKYLPTQPFKTPYCLDDEEITKILDKFSSKQSYSYYYDLVVFWLNTGCRPSEALGLRWRDVSSDFTHVTFKGSPQRVSGKGIVWSEGSKNFKKGGHRAMTRTIPINANVQKILQARHAILSPEPNDIVFSNRVGKYIDYTCFCKHIWRQCVKTIEGLEHLTPYNLRDTFITRQLCKGVPIAVIAAWCDNSPSVIESRYTDYVSLAIAKIVPEIF
jgi:integrase